MRKIVTFTAVAVMALTVGCGGGGSTTDQTVATERPPTVITHVKCPPHGVLPNPDCTPGVADPRVTQANIDQTICMRGYSKSVRPPVSVTAPIKVQVERDYAVPDPHPRPFAQEELDHLISLELGGAPADVKNLWPEPAPSYHQKDAVENYLHKQVCAHRITLAIAQHEVTTDWVAVYESAGLASVAGPPPPIE